MKILVATLLLLCTFYVIKVDMVEGTIPLAFSSGEKCGESMEFIAIKPIPGDTIQSVFAMYPANKPVSFQERLADFYKINPHLIKQKIKEGEQVFLPIYATTEACK
ncbi:hypothetical protein [Psychrobacillus sp.]|uniref:hypothetical protein n=1 Tax=Psychrobacillus sp. TaxID=1871623 RepID=UPI0028BD74CA|nr:hypothetical protein [Psychrobacillus sp.]